MAMKRLLLVAAFLFLPNPAPAADLAVKGPPPVINATPDHPYSWTGFYLGGNVGLGAESGNFSTFADPIALFGTTTLGIGTPNPSVPMKGFLGGATAGYNHQFGDFVLGLEGDIDWAGLSGSSSNSWSATIGPPATTISLNSMATDKLGWLGTARARIGFTPVQNLLLYGTGGVAIGEVEASYGISTAITGLTQCPIFCGGSSISTTKTGWVAGAGVEYAVTKSWLVKAEYIHADLGSVGGSFATTGLINLPMTVHWSTKADFDIARVGFGYRFP